ncbi:UNVERIFIED_ORG: hypothetical protein QE446_004068 [Rhizobium sp. SORGH_AS260]|uniref:hypothetical protein n=1 Tax=Agrobacterium sp. SORGH_AS_0440 TaxID=3041757 RepID=UPI002780E162|nr:hypothetical protein [Agrobacterium sp. SORGH_AS_0440]MDP9731971.1 hypothetical protein [Rhizobium sp. SORGH_AS_0285]MDP9756192.1 hypothetical protein [Rhizobium sp. SORGH_AS_0260]MDR6081147.1 hypothetical protein [Agrobacterium sp. SORGH_AS_0440]
MTRAHSPGYPNASLPKAIGQVRSIHTADRRHIIDRDVAAKHIGYSGQSGASDKALASLAHYGLLEKAGKGQTRVTQLAVDILHPVDETARKKALIEAAFTPTIFAEIRDRFQDGVPSEGALKSWLTRENFLDRAIGPVVSAYMETRRYLEQEGAFESDDLSYAEVSEPIGSKKTLSVEDSTRFGGAKVGDLIQWESQGVLQLPKPQRVRLVSEDGNWVVIDGSQTGIPMQEVIVEVSAPIDLKPPTFPILQENQSFFPAKGETEWMRNSLSNETNIRVLVRGEMGPKEIGKLIRLLEAQKAVLEED